MFDYELFCKKLTYLRQAKEYNKYQMSIQANIYYQYYCNIESGRAIPNFKAVISIANALHVNLSELLSERINDDVDIIKLNIISNIKEIDNLSLINKCYDILLLIKNRDVQ